MVTLTLALRNIWRNPKRSIITFSAIAIGVWSAVFLSALARGLSVGMADDAINNLVGHIKIHATNYIDDPASEHSFALKSEITEDQLNELGISSITKRVRVPAVILSERESVGATLVGINPKDEVSHSFIGVGVHEGRMLDGTDDDGVIIGRKMAQLLKTSLGKRIVIVAQDYNNKVAERGFRIIGIYDAKLESTERTYVFLARKVAQDFLSLGERLSEITFKFNDIEHLDDKVDHLKNMYPDLEVYPWYVLEPLVSAFRSVQDGFLIIWFFIVIIAVSFGVVNTQLMSTFERIREFGVMIALGLKPNLLLSMVTLEAFIILFIGLILGNVLGLLTFVVFAEGINLSAFAAGVEQFGLSKVVYPRFILNDWILCDLLLLVIGILSSLYPAWRASRNDPVSSITGRGF